MSEVNAILYGWNLTEICQKREFGRAFISDIDTAHHLKPSFRTSLVQVFGENVFLGLLMLEAPASPFCRDHLQYILRQGIPEMNHMVRFMLEQAKAALPYVCESCDSASVAEVLSNDLPVQPTFSIVQYTCQLLGEGDD